jgi:hypothetical protein
MSRYSSRLPASGVLVVGILSFFFELANGAVRLFFVSLRGVDFWSRGGALSMDACFSTTVMRARAPHLLRDHHLRFLGHGRDPVPLYGTELDQRLEAARRRNRGSRQRARENLRQAPAASPDVGIRLVTSARASSPVAVSPAIPVFLEDEDWGDAVIDLGDL